jgi:dimethylhistidine N-methyltransferase
VAASAALRAPYIDPAVADAALPGLLAPRKTLPPKLFYDVEGCRLFGEITRLPEYYPTRTEMALLRQVAAEAVDGIGPGASLIEYGASDEGKAAVLLEAGPDFTAYVPIDVAGSALRDMVARMRTTHPRVAVYPVEADFLRPFALPGAVRDMARTGFFPGSTIGNLDPVQARRFLATARSTLGPGARFLVGVDLEKDLGLLLPAYNDAQGVTAAFNLNLLRRLNREAAADFDLSAFGHEAVWNAEAARIEMHLVSLQAQTVQVAGRPIAFTAGETIHTENSYKYTVERFAVLAAESGWRSDRVWVDEDKLFSIHLLRTQP